MKPNLHFKTSRAVGSEFVKRKLTGIATIIVILSFIFIAAGIWLTTISAWWWILLTIIFAWVFLAMVLLLIAWFAVRIFRPQMTADQRHAVSDFVDKIERVSETIQITPYMIFFKILKDMLFPPKKTFIEQIAKDSASLHTDYLYLTNLFK